MKEAYLRLTAKANVFSTIWPKLVAMVRLVMATPILFFALSATCHADWSDDAEIISKLMSAGHYAEAEAVASRSLAKGPGTILFPETGTLTIHNYRGLARALIGNTTGAIEDADAIIKADSSIYTPDAGYTMRGMVYAMEGKTEDALASFQAAMDKTKKGMGKNGRTAMVYGARGFAKIVFNDLDGAEVDLSQAIGHDYEWTMSSSLVPLKKVWENAKVAIVKLKAGDIAGGRVAIDKSLSIDCGAEYCELFFAFPRMALTTMVSLPQPSATARNSIASRPKATGTAEDARAHFERGMATIERSKNTDDWLFGADEFRMATEIDSGMASSWFNLGLILVQLEELDGAIAAFQRYLEISPEAEDALALRDQLVKLEYRRDHN